MRFFGLTLIRSLAVTPVAGDVIWLEVSTDGVIFEDTHHFLKSVRDEDEGDEAGEALLGEARHVLDDVAGVCGHQDQTLETRVQADPEPDLHVVYVIVSEHRRHEESNSTQDRWLLHALPHGCAAHMLNSYSSFSKISIGPVELRMMRGWPLKKQKTAPAKAVPKKLSITPWKRNKGKTENCDRKEEKTPDLTYVLFLVKISEKS